MWVCETFSLMNTCQNLFLKVNDETILAVELHVFRGLQLKKPDCANQIIVGYYYQREEN